VLGFRFNVGNQAIGDSLKVIDKSADVSVLDRCPGRRLIDLVSACYNAPREVDELQNVGSEPELL